MQEAMIYFDNAATTPVSAEVAEIMNHIQVNYFGNPSSIHSVGRKTRVIIESARTQIAEYLHVKPSEIYFTGSGTEAIQIALWNAMFHLKVKTVITSKLEHHAVLHALEALTQFADFQLFYVNFNNKGEISFSHLQQLLHTTSKPVLVCLMHANNEIGTLLNHSELKDITKKYDAFVLSDTVQTMGKLAVLPKESSLHFATCSAHKFHGPKGCGFLYADERIALHPILPGGGQERGIRSATENIAGIAGMAKAFELAFSNLTTTQLYVKKLKKIFIDKLFNLFPNLEINGQEDGLHTIVNIGFPFTEKTEMLAYLLDLKGIAVSSGSACHSGAVNQSHVIQAIKPDVKQVPVRFSFSRYNTVEEIDRVVETISEILIN